MNVWAHIQCTWRSGDNFMELVPGIELKPPGLRGKCFTW